jgi:curved DNA-binding protein CbpA
MEGTVSREERFRDLYELLGVPRAADAEALRAAFGRRARELRATNGDDRLRDLTYAYEVLSKPRSRRIYDRLAYRAPGDGGFSSTDDAAGDALGGLALVGDDDPVGWSFAGDPAEPASAPSQEDRVLRGMAAVALLIATVLFAIVVLHSHA